MSVAWWVGRTDPWLEQAQPLPPTCPRVGRRDQKVEFKSLRVPSQEDCHHFPFPFLLFTLSSFLVGSSVRPLRAVANLLPFPLSHPPILIMAPKDRRSKTTKNVDKPSSWTCDYGCAVFLRCFPSRGKTPPKVTVDGGHRHDCPFARMAKKERSRPPGETARNFRSLKWLGARRIGASLTSDLFVEVSWRFETRLTDAGV